MQGMSKTEKLGRLLANAALLPHARRIVKRDRQSRSMPAVEAQIHLRAAVDWLEAAIDVNREHGGVSAGFHLRMGWLPPFPETTGYIIPTLFDYARFSGKDRYRRMGIDLADWEVRIQRSDGSVRTDIGINEEATVFDTGQGLFGFVRAWEECGEGYAKAAIAAGDWLLERQDDDGCWRRDTFRSVPHTYNTRSAWALIRLGGVSGEERFHAGGSRNLRWALGQQNSDGWLQENSFYPQEAPLTHTIAYSIRGLLEGGLLLEDDSFVEAAVRASRPLRDLSLDRKRLAGTYAAGWQGDDSFSCLTGNAQLAIVFFILDDLCPNELYGDAARALTQHLRGQQDLESSLPGIRGGIKGSVPVDGKYSPMVILNWATKFFVDALMLEIVADRGEKPSLGRTG